MAKQNMTADKSAAGKRNSTKRYHAYGKVTKKPQSAPVPKKQRHAKTLKRSRRALRLRFSAV